MKIAFTNIEITLLLFYNIVVLSALISYRFFGGLRER